MAYVECARCVSVHQSAGAAYGSIKIKITQVNSRGRGGLAGGGLRSTTQHHDQRKGVIFLYGAVIIKLYMIVTTNPNTHKQDMFVINVSVICRVFFLMTSFAKMIFIFVA